MDGEQIKHTFLEFFVSKSHLAMPSSSLIPAGDPTMLFTTAGMVPFKPFYNGEITPPSRRLTSCQKSFRTTDIDEVGDHKHLTFFEMLGNFSIGDYFKRDAIVMAWDLMTQHFGLSADRLFATIYLDDEDAFRYWNEDIGIPKERIYRYGGKDNWWGPAGGEGPCGPCSEIHYDSGSEYGCGPMVPPGELTALQLRNTHTTLPTCHPNCNCERFVELWNLVFMQFYQDSDGTRTPLPAPSIDTGLGLERIAAVLQDKRSLYETDLFWPIIQAVCQLTSKTYGQNAETDYALRVVAEHGRAASFLIADGVIPENDGRGYVLRRILRRAIRYGRRLGPMRSLLTHVCVAVINRFKDSYPEIAANQEFIMKVVALEEERFFSAISTGLPLLEEELVPFHHLLSTSDNANAQLVFATLTGRVPDTLVYKLMDLVDHEDKANKLKHEISGAELFILFDTYGLPPELTAEIAREHGLEVDMVEFGQEMKTHQDQSRASHSFKGRMEESHSTYANLGVDNVTFLGYHSLKLESQVAALIVDNTPVAHVTNGQSVDVVLHATPFYPEGGGQVGDVGCITGQNGKVLVNDTQRPTAGLIFHRGVVQDGSISLGEPVAALVDLSRRQDTARNHSGTHILHASLRQILGPHVRQAGSLVTPDRLRFDYNHVAPLSHDEQLEIQSLANQKIRENLAVTTYESTFAEAVQYGALAFFGDKYGEVVRVVRMGGGETVEEDSTSKPFSLEVCGGTHVRDTGQIGSIFVLSDSSIGGGMCRVEALTGRAAEQLYVQRSTTLETLARKLETPLGDLEIRLDSFMAENERLRKRLESLERQALRVEAHDLASKVIDISGTKLVAGRTSASSAESMRELGDYIKAKFASAVIVLGSLVDGRPMIVAMVTDDLVVKGHDASKIVKEASAVMEGSGGGRPNLAQAGGKRPDKLDSSLEVVEGIVRRAIS
jgi:alanyl-tRNA synthetase